MAKSPSPPQVLGSNSQLSKEDQIEIQAGVARMKALEADRSEINADINAERKKIIAMGVPAEALRASLARAKMDPDQRSDFDRGREQVDLALGIPVQSDLFASEDGDGEPEAPVVGKTGTGLPALH